MYCHDVWLVFQNGYVKSALPVNKLGPDNVMMYNKNCEMLFSLFGNLT
jgi:hypothetical protein